MNHYLPRDYDFVGIGNQAGLEVRRDRAEGHSPGIPTIC
jgi:hypothetical protein